MVKRSNSRNWGGDGGGGGDERTGKLLIDDLFGPQLVPRIDVGEEETHRDRLDAFVPQRSRRAAHAVFIQGLQDLALGRRQTLADDFAVAAANQRPVLPRDVLHDRVVLRTLVAADVQDVAVALVGDHARPRPVVLEYGIGGDGGAVKDVIDTLGGDLVVRAQLSDAADGGERGILGRGRHLVDECAPAFGVREHDVGKGAAYVDADELHVCLGRSRATQRLEV